VPIGTKPKSASWRLATGWTVWYRIPVGARFFAPVQTGPGAHPASYTTGTGSFPRRKRPRRDADHPPHLAPRLKKEYSYTYTPLLAFVACSTVKFIARKGKYGSLSYKQWEKH
jgi:hypothetical protein